MAQRPKAKRKQKKLKGTDEKQSARFIEMARALGADESGKEFESAFRKLVPPKPKK